MSCVISYPEEIERRHSRWLKLADSTGERAVEPAGGALLAEKMWVGKRENYCTGPSYDTLVYLQREINMSSLFALSSALT